MTTNQSENKEHTAADQNLNATDTINAVADGFETAKTKTAAVGHVLADSVKEFGDKVEQKEAEMTAPPEPPSKMEQAKEKVGQGFNDVKDKLGQGLNDAKDMVGSVFSGDKQEDVKDEKKEPTLVEQAQEVVSGESNKQ